MRTATVALMTLLTVASLTADALAQEPGTRVSVLVPHPFGQQVRRSMVLDRIEGDSIWVHGAYVTTALAVAQAQPRVPAGGNYGKQGSIAGALIGAVAGGFVGHANYDPPPRSCSPGGTSMLFGDYGPSCSGGYDSPAHTLETVGGASIGMLGGLLVGWMVGSKIERWTPLQVETRATPGGDVVLSLSR